MSVAEMTVDELKVLMREAFLEAMLAPMPDDEGQIRPEFEQELRASLAGSDSPSAPTRRWIRSSENC